jgi:hypothetical protein
MAGIRDYSGNENTGTPTGTVMAPGLVPLGLYPTYWTRFVALGASGTALGGFFPMPMPIKYGVGITIPVRLLKGSAPSTFAAAADWTPGAGDVTVSKDGGADTNIGTLPSVLPSTTYQWGITLSASEAQAKRLVVTIHDDGAAVIDDSFDFFTYGDANALWPTNFEATVLPVNASAVYGSASAASSLKNALDGTGGVTITANITGDLAGSVTSVLNGVTTTSNIKKNQPLATFAFLMTDSTSHAPVTSQTPSCTRSIDGGAFAAGTLANVAEVGAGIYTVDFAAGDLNGSVVLLKATAAACDTTFERIITVP